ncbi:acyl-CoA synthetase [Sporosarcina soli]|uniref:Acyl-CoA synthetase n=1 Tax=Sporosarcina soli TaxID=334736 RepID=A0ABW0TFQ0_9BACL
MKTYEELKKNFSWKEAEIYFDWNPGENVNMAHLICDRWTENAEKVAIYWEDELGNQETWTFTSLKEKSNQMANALRSMGIKKGDRVTGLLGKEMELIVFVLAAWKVGAIYVPLFTAFGPEAIKHRLTDSKAGLIVTNKEQAQKLEGMNLPLQVLLVDDLNSEGKTFWEFVDSFSSEHEVEQTTAEDPSIIQYTSGTTGLPKGAMIGHKSCIALYPYMKYGVHVEEDEVFFGGADMGWAYGLMACTFAPLSFGARVVVYKGSFDVKKIYGLLEKHEVTNFTYAPTAYRMMMAAGTELLKKYKLKVKKFSSAGESLNDEVVNFFYKNLGKAIYDHYGSTETGMIINNYNITDMVVKPGSMGLPLPGYKVGLIDKQGGEVGLGEIGEIAIDVSQRPVNFMGYWENPADTKQKYLDKWFMTGDLARQDEDGYFWFQGRTDDVIMSAGYRIGPTEIENVLLQHPAVLETAVVGIPDAVKGELVKAFVVLNESSKASDELGERLKSFVKSKLSKHQYPKEIEFIGKLPKTQSGKTQRYLLKNVK